MTLPLPPAVAIACLALAWCRLGLAADPVPTLADVPFGPHPRQRLDVYAPEGPGPFPVLIWYGRLWEPGPTVPPVARMARSRVATVGVPTRTEDDAGRRRRHSHAERGDEVKLSIFTGRFGHTLSRRRGF